MQKSEKTMCGEVCITTHSEASIFNMARFNNYVMNPCLNCNILDIKLTLIMLVVDDFLCKACE